MIQIGPDGHWHVRTGNLENLPSKELKDLEEYFSETRLNYLRENNEVSINGALRPSVVKELLEFFYDGIADVTIS